MKMASSRGPAPNPKSRRQTGNQAHTWTDLPAGGYKGEIPEWPFVAVSGRELEVWEHVWRMPHGAAWARDELTRDVAMYVRHSVRAERGDIEDAREARMWSDRLGMNPQAMLRNRWRVKEDETAERRTPKPARDSSTKRMKIADTDAVAG